MNMVDIKKIAKDKAPEVEIIKHQDFYRHDVLSVLQGNNCVGIELGVAGGHFSKRMVESEKIKKFFGVDLYEDHHDIKEYKDAIGLVGLEKNYVLLRMSFDDACDLFDDDFFDFIYFDGYAHTGEEGGKTFANWYRKLKIGGVFAGDDYHEDWPLVVWAVNHLVAQTGCELHVTGKTEATHLNRYPSWFFVKTDKQNIVPCDELLTLGNKIRNTTRKQNKNVQLSMDDVVKLLQQIKNQHPGIAEELKKIL